MDLIQQELIKVERYFNSIKKKEISLQTIEHQLNLFISGVKIPELVKPCTPGDGIVQIPENQFSDLINEFNTASLSGRITKFVPASGAASRMFQKLFSVLNRFPKFSLRELKSLSEDDKECKYVYDFLTNLKKFAFYDDMKSALAKDDFDIQNLISEDPGLIIKSILFEPGLDYLSKPKGAIKFHRYDDESRTAFEEQVFESLHYAADINNKVHIHFTISEENEILLNQIINKIKLKLANTDFKIDISYSFQKKYTDTIAVNEKNKILFDKNGDIIFRPAGHGALLENLNELDADIIVIKNIDNLTVEKLAADTIHYKKLLIGLLVKTQQVIFNYLQSLKDNDLDGSNFNSMIKFAEQTLSITFPYDFKNWSVDKKKIFLFEKFNRPLRVCGMVKNEGEPGGGPFWVKDDDGSLSLQIIEQAQVDMNNETQRNIFKQSTHFNPVDIVCGVMDYKGNKFNLKNYVDTESGIITKKSKDGIELKALELPGLWNGSMAYWNTIFVEVPISTFNPVKEINDLLRQEHQS